MDNFSSCEEDDEKGRSENEFTKHDDDKDFDGREKNKKKFKSTESNNDFKKSKKSTSLINSKKTASDIHQRRKEGRIKAAATIAQNLKKLGIGRFEEQNGFGLTCVKTVPLINQKNYFADYLKKDEQISFIRNWRNEKIIQHNLKNLKKNDSSVANEQKTCEPMYINEFDKRELTKKKNCSQFFEEEEEDEDENEDPRDEKMKIGHDTIIIHPGSLFIRIGRATDAVPKNVPNVIAISIKKAVENNDLTPYPIRKYNKDNGIYFSEEFDLLKSEILKDFRARMRYYKRRVLPNSREMAANFNKKQTPELIPDHNDPCKKEWLDVSSSELENTTFLVGEQALKLPLGSKFCNNWKLRFPIVNGSLNEFSDDYSSPQEILGDLTHIVCETLNQMEVKNLPQLKVILIIPDMYDKLYVESWVFVLMKYVGFGKVSIIQESVAATFGVGVTSACVVDVGAHKTSISCVDEGMVINDSRVILSYGGDHVTECFIKLMLENSFPYKDMNLKSATDDWELAQKLKHDYITFQDANVAIQLYHFFKRKPFETTQKYEFKVFDEVMLAPLGLFFPEIFQIETNSPSSPSLKSINNSLMTQPNRLFNQSKDQYTDIPNNPISKSQISLKTRPGYSDLSEKDLLIKVHEQKFKNIEFDDNYQKKIYNVSLEKAIIESITNAGLASDMTKISKFYDNLLIVGGGFSTISGFDQILADRINIWRPKILSTNYLDEILDYINTEVKIYEENKKNLINEKKIKRKKNDDQPLDEISLPKEDLEDIEKSVLLNLDLNHVESICNKGSSSPVNILPPPRELDPQIITWKGGSVYGRLKVVNEMWITQKDWDLLGSRCLYYKSLFNY